MNKRQRVVETLKTLLIVALTCSALWLMGESQMLRMSGLVGASRHREGTTASSEVQTRAVRPMHMAVINQGGCFAVQYNSQELDVVFDRMAPLLNEALSGSDMPRPMTREDWEEALVTAPGVYFDFQGGIPLQALSAWLSGQENAGLTAHVRHLLLVADGEEGVELAFRDELSGQYLVCPARLVNLSHLQSAVDQVTPNGAIFACQAANYRQLAPHTIISAQTPRLREYAASNPLPADEDDRLDRLLEALSFPLGITTVYETPEGRRARSGNDTLSISNDGLVTYYSTREEERYPVSGKEGDSALFAAVDGATRLMRSALDLWRGEASIYLEQVEEVARDSWRLEFCYALDDTPVQVGQRGYAATVLVEEGYITEFELQLRTYAALEQTALILPQEQAAAALIQLGGTGSRLQLRYQDSGEHLRVGWIAY